MKNFTIKCLTIAAVVFAMLPELKAQNEPIIAHFMYHTNVFNPAVAGNTRDFHLGVLARQQWVGMKEAPSTQLLDFYGYIPKIRGGIGFVFVNDMLGKQRNTNFRISYAYSQRMADRAYVSLGISLGMLNMGLKGDQLIYQDKQTIDPSGIFTPENKFKPYLGLGLEFDVYKFVFGFSLTNLDQSLKKATVYKLPRHYFAYAKYNWDINERVTFSPGVFVRSSAFATQVEANLSVTFKKRITAGLYYRSVDAAGALLGVNITKHLFVSYSYDYDFGALSGYQTGSHELNITYRFDGIKEKKVFYKSGRYMN